MPDGPPLEVPQPPPREIAAIEEPIPPATPEERPAAQPASPRPAPPVAARPPAARPEPKTEAVAESPPPSEVRTLRAPGRDDAKERAIRDRLAGASRTLARVDYAKLSRDGRSQYEQSKRFAQQAEQALREHNLVFAATLADKAATLAAELVR